MAARAADNGGSPLRARGAEGWWASARGGLGRFNPFLLQALFRSRRRLGRDIEYARGVLGLAAGRGAVGRLELRREAAALAARMGVPGDASKLSNDLLRAGLLVGVEAGGGRLRVLDVVASYSSPTLALSWHGRRLLDSGAPEAAAAGYASNMVVREVLVEVEARWGGEARLEGREGLEALSRAAAAAVHRLASTAAGPARAALERLASALASGALAPRLAQGFLAPLEALTGGRAAERLPGGAYVLRPGEALALAPPELDEGELRRAYCEAARSFGYEVPAAGWGPPVPVAVVAEGLGVDPGVLWALLEERAKYGRVALEAVPGPGGVEYTRFLRLRGEDLRGCTG